MFVCQSSSARDIRRYIRVVLQKYLCKCLQAKVRMQRYIREKRTYSKGTYVNFRKQKFARQNTYAKQNRTEPRRTELSQTEPNLNKLSQTKPKWTETNYSFCFLRVLLHLIWSIPSLPYYVVRNPGLVGVPRAGRREGGLGAAGPGSWWHPLSGEMHPIYLVHW